MRAVVVAIALSLSLLESSDHQARPPAFSSATSITNGRIDFDRQLKPIFEAKCMPCHFKGGKVYERIPFDKPQTIRLLGTKLFTRIKDEDERRLIREFLAQTP